MFGRRPVVKLSPEVFEKAEKAAEAAGYSDVSEFVEHVLLKELSKLDGAADDAELKERLRGLGYIS
jgi:hypothetical protein